MDPTTVALTADQAQVLMALAFVVAFTCGVVCMLVFWRGRL